MHFSELSVSKIGCAPYINAYFNEVFTLVSANMLDLDEIDLKLHIIIRDVGCVEL